MLGRRPPFPAESGPEEPASAIRISAVSDFVVETAGGHSARVTVCCTMSEAKMVGLAQDALAARGIEDEVIAAGQFNPRGQARGLFMGGLAGAEAGSLVGGVAEDVGLAAGSLAGMNAVDAASGLPAKMLVAVSTTTVYGFAAPSRRSAPTALVFQLPLADLTVRVHKRVNVRVVELVHDASGSRIELEGNRLPVTHSKDVIEALQR